MESSVLAMFAVECVWSSTTATFNRPCRTLDIEPMVIEVSEGENQKVVAYDSETLFKSAKAAYENRRYMDCVKTYDQLLNKFPQSFYVHASQYNIGLSRRIEAA